MNVKTYDKHSKAKISQKGIIAWLEPAEQLRQWTLFFGPVYQRVVNFYVINLKQNGQTLNKVNSTGDITNEGDWFFDSDTKTIYFYPIGGGNPSDYISTVFYRIPFSSFPFNGPIDDNGREVGYSSSISSVAKFNHELDHDDQIGIALSSDSTIKMFTDQFFIDWYDRLIWEKKRVKIWSYSPGLPFSEKKLYFDGKIENKNYNDSNVSFSIKDFLNVLKEKIPLDNYLTSDNFDIDDSQIGKAKRRIYGRVSGLKAISLNKILDGFKASGTFSGVAGSSTISGVSGNLLNEASFEDTIIIGDQEFKIDDITNDNLLTISEEIETSFSASEMRIKPEIESVRTGRNTTFLISDKHALKEGSALITERIQGNRFKLNNTEGFTVDDFVTISGLTRIIRQVSSNNVITINQTIITGANVGDSVTRNPIQKVFANGLQFTVERDYSVINNSSGSRLIIDSDAEFNLARPITLSGATFTNGSRFVDFSGINVKANFKSRDFVKPKDVNFGNWGEVLKVDEDNNRLVLRSAWVDANFTGNAFHKSIKPIGDETIVTVECFGKTENNEPDGVWIENGPQVIKDILSESGIDQELNIASFNTASVFANHLVSLALPLKSDGEAPTIRSVVELINKSVFGSLHYGNDFSIEYNILNASKPNILPSEVIKDEDVTKWSVQSNSKNILSNVKGNFRHQDADRFEGKEAASQVEHTNDFARFVLEIERSETFDFYLWNESSTTVMVQRKAFLNELSQAIMTVISDLEFASKAINGKVLVDFDRLFARFGSISENDKRKIMIVAGISKTESGVELKLDDLGNVWNRVANIMANGSNVFDSSTKDEKILGGFITNSNGLINELHETSKLNVIG